MISPLRDTNSVSTGSPSCTLGPDSRSSNFSLYHAIAASKSLTPMAITPLNRVMADIILRHSPLCSRFPVESSLILVHDDPLMQTLNVGAGRTDDEYKAAEEQRRADLRSDVQTYAMYFFIAAGLAVLGTGL